jgi:hypothetical protein
VNPWKLMQWMGHKRIDETMLYVHFAEAISGHSRSRFFACNEATMTPDRKVIAMLSARGICVPRGSGVAVNDPQIRRKLYNFSILVGGADGT